MTNLIYGNKIRNIECGNKKKPGISVRELFWAFLLIIPVAGSLVFQLWVRGEITHTGYMIQELTKKEEALTRERAKLIVKVEELQRPERIDRVARLQLGMTPLRPEQVLAPQTRYYKLSDGSIMALKQ